MIFAFSFFKNFFPPNEELFDNQDSPDVFLAQGNFAQQDLKDFSRPDGSLRLYNFDFLRSPPNTKRSKKSTQSQTYDTRVMPRYVDICYDFRFECTFIIKLCSTCKRLKMIRGPYCLQLPVHHEFTVCSRATILD